MWFESAEQASRAYRRAPAAFFQKVHERGCNERDLISPEWTWYATRYHYNLVENGIIDLLLEAQRPVTGNVTLDVGTGTGHWIDFHRDVLEAPSVVAVDFCETAVERLRQSHGGRRGVEIRLADITRPQPDLDGRFDLVTGVGVLFHVVDDAAWQETLRHLCRALRPGGIAIVGGEFGDRTTDLGVMRRVRSLARWREALAEVGGRVIGLRRFAWFGNDEDRGLKDNLLAFTRT
jgi:SAM-dependent methyltransferase